MRVFRSRMLSGVSITIPILQLVTVSKPLYTTIVGTNKDYSMISPIMMSDVLPSRRRDGLYDSIANAKAENIIMEGDTGAEESTLKVMVSPAGWPADEDITKCFVRKCIVDIVANFLKEEKYTKQSIILIGQPGIGKSIAGGYIVNQCLAAIDNAVVVYAVRDSIYVFHRKVREAYEYIRTLETTLEILDKYPDCLFVFDCGEGFKIPAGKYTRTIVLSPPIESYYEEFCEEKANYARRIYVPLWSDDEIMRMCVSLELDYGVVKKRVEEFGPIPRYIINEQAAHEKRKNVERLLKLLQHLPNPHKMLYCQSLESDSYPSYELMMMDVTIDETNNKTRYECIPCNPMVVSRIMEIIENQTILCKRKK